MWKTIFLTSFFVIFYAYFGYPISIYLIGILCKNQNRKELKLFPVTMIITAHNEEKRIMQKIENTLSVIYPREKIQIIIASDGSTDKTNEIARKYKKDGIELIEIANRGGKENAQKEALKHAKGEIFVFTDVATILEPLGIQRIVSNFSDPSIGCVSSEDRLMGKDGKNTGEGMYVRYEMWLRKLESSVNTLVGLSGSFFAARKSVCHDFSQDMQSDFRTLLNSVKMGLRGVIDPEAIGYYSDVLNPKREFDRKVRTVQRGLTVFFSHLEFMNIFKYGLFSYQFFCHKLLRWLVPFSLMTAFLSNIFLAKYSIIFFVILIAHLSFYSVALLGWKRIDNSSMAVFKLPVYFLTVNASIFMAWLLFIKNQRVVMWTPTER